MAGYSGSGKTTLIERLLPELRQRGYRVGVIKHHAHALAFDVAGKDSDRFWQAGAEAVAMISPERTVLMRRSWPVENLQALANLLAVDLVLAEGFKRTHWPRLLVLSERPGEAEKLAQGRPILAAVGPGGSALGYPRYSPDDIAGIAGCIESWLRKCRAAEVG
ncbi:MAG: molybdopterin-guanine dinucleotide biosynthesis protein B [Anaerolineae bacterium]